MLKILLIAVVLALGITVIIALVPMGESNPPLLANAELSGPADFTVSEMAKPTPKPKKTPKPKSTRNPNRTPTPIPCGGPVFGEDLPSEGALRLLSPSSDWDGDPDLEGFSRGCYGGVAITAGAHPDTGGTADLDAEPFEFQMEFYTSRATEKGLIEYSIVNTARIPDDEPELAPEWACEYQWEYVPGGIYVPCAS